MLYQKLTIRACIYILIHFVTTLLFYVFVNILQVLKYSQTDWNKLKQELELDFQAKLLNKEREWSKKLADREKTISSLEDNLKFHKQSNEDMRYDIPDQKVHKCKVGKDFY